MHILTNFADRLSELMFEKDITAEELEKAINISDANISNWRNGKGNIMLSNTLKLTAYFKCSINFLIGRTDNKLDYIPQDCLPFYTRLLQVMKEYGKSRYRIVKDTKFSDGNFYRWKCGSDPYLQSVIDLADYFGCTVDYLVGLEK